MFSFLSFKGAGAAKDVQAGLSSLKPTEKDKEVATREQERKLKAAELEKKNKERAERKSKLTEQWAKNKA